VRFRDHRRAGDTLELARRYRDQGADELVFYDITASVEGRAVRCAWVERVARVLDIPFCVAGGIRTVADAEAVLAAGADKISVNTPALENPSLIDELAKRFGSQCVVIGIDSLGASPGQSHTVLLYTGDYAHTRSSLRLTTDWIHEVQERGAGEIVLNCMDQDGMRSGYDLEQLTAARTICRVPLVASGGAGVPDHFANVFLQAGVDAALAASVFHGGDLTIPSLKAYLRQRGIPVRL